MFVAEDCSYESSFGVERQFGFPNRQPANSKRLPPPNSLKLAERTRKNRNGEGRIENMTSYEDYIEFYPEPTLAGESDWHGEFCEYGIREVHPDIQDIVLDQVSDIYIEGDDSYIDYYARRYHDGSTRLWVGIHEDFTTSGRFEEREIELDDELSGILDSAPLEFF